jgi:hypothetical protein
MPIETLRDVGLHRLADLVHRQRVALLTLSHTDDQLASRPLRPEGRTKVWMHATRGSLGHVAGSAQGSPGCLGLCDVDQALHMSVPGPRQLDGGARRRAGAMAASRAGATPIGPGERA